MFRRNCRRKKVPASGHRQVQKKSSFQKEREYAPSVLKPLGWRRIGFARPDRYAAERKEGLQPPCRAFGVFAATVLRARRNPNTGEGVRPAPPVLMGRQRRVEGIEVDSGSALIPDSEAGKKTLGRKKNYRNKCDGGSKALI